VLFRVLSFVVQSKLLPRSHDEFRSREYWDAFFHERQRSGGGVFEWYGDWRDVQSTLMPRLMKAPSRSPADVSVLVVGCGNSSLSADMYDAGFTSITSVDFSEAVIAQMRASSASRPGMRWEVMNVKAMTLPDESFDLVMDKVRVCRTQGRDTVAC
jgi:2-polyprenyl-3-methyl-5-hydroxy-6-metoxy-1,4-benzoquinol methylase